MIRFWLNGVLVEEDHVAGTTTLLRYLRDQLRLTGTKEGCAEGDCGACTVAVLEEGAAGPVFRAVNACLLFLPMVQGKRVFTIEALRDRSAARTEPASGYHPAQVALVEARGSQCGYCTPGIAMSMFEATYREDLADPAAVDPAEVDDQVAGNLCRCTGYRPIREAVRAVAGLRPEDRFLAELRQFRPRPASLQGPREASGSIYLQPDSVRGVLEARAAHPSAVLVAGGTDVALEVTKRHRALPVVIGLEGVDALRGIEEIDGGWRVGATTTLTRLDEELGGELPALRKMLRVFGSRQIRSRATLGGNLVNASPIGDLPPVLVALDATAIAVGSQGTRRIPMTAFFTGYRQTALAPDEILLAVELPRPDRALRTGSYKVSKRRELDISTVSAGMAVRVCEGRVEELRLAYGGVAPRAAARAERTERALVGGPWTRAAVEQALPLLAEDFAPIDDLRGSARYRTLLVRNMLLGFYLHTSTTERVAS